MTTMTTAKRWLSLSLMPLKKLQRINAMTKWIENIEEPVVWAVMAEKDGQLQMCRAGSHPMIYVSQAMARAQMRRLKNEGWERPLKIVRFTADSEILNWREGR